MLSIPVYLRNPGGLAVIISAVWMRCATQSPALPQPDMRLPGGRAPVYRLHTPNDFAEIKRQGSIAYSERVDGKLLGCDRTPLTISPYTRVVPASDGSRTLEEFLPDKRVPRLLSKSDGLQARREYDAALRLCRQALALDSACFVSWIHLGNAERLCKDLVPAENHILKGLSLNGSCYLGYLYLADLHIDKGDPGRAWESFARAFALNPQGADVAASRGRIMERCGMRLRVDRLCFPFAVNRTGPGSCEILYRDEVARAWSGMAFCLACWRMDAQFSPLFAEAGRSIPMKHTMYRECLLNQSMMVAGRKTRQEAVLPQEELLLRAVADTCLGAVLYWELISREAPQVVLLLSPEEQNRIVRYIRTYVFEPNK